MKYLIQTDSISDEKSKDLEYGRVVLDTTNNAIYTIGYSDVWTCNMVDLLLPSGTLWMDRNLGASSPEDAGLYFAWGETQGYTADEVGTKKQFSWDDYKFGTMESITKYNSTDGLTTLEAIDDAVLLNVHKYSMPTKEQMEELLKETDVYCIKEDGTEVHGTYQEDHGSDDNVITWDSEIVHGEKVSGFEFRKKTDKSIKIFFPSVGLGFYGTIEGIGEGTCLWANSGGSVFDNSAYGMLNGTDGCNFTVYSRNAGCSVRGVAVATQQ